VCVSPDSSSSKRVSELKIQASTRQDSAFVKGRQMYCVTSGPRNTHFNVLTGVFPDRTQGLQRDAPFRPRQTATIIICTWLMRRVNQHSAPSWLPVLPFLELLSCRAAILHTCALLWTRKVNASVSSSPKWELARRSNGRHEEQLSPDRYRGENYGL
jgi:hypothetical protein